MNKPLLVALVLAFAAFGCDHKRTDRADHVARTQGHAPEKMEPASTEMPQVNYAAAVVFEGGQGKADGSETQSKPAWRVYICLKKSESPVTGALDLDFTKLGNPYTQQTTARNDNGREISLNSILGKVHIDYTYSTKLNSDPSQGYASGEAEFAGKSTQVWSTIGGAGKPNVTDLEIFNPEITTRDLTAYKAMNYQINGQDFYILQKLERFAYSKPDQTMHVLDVCERNSTEVVWQFGDDIKE